MFIEYLEVICSLCPHEDGQDLILSAVKR